MKLLNRQLDAILATRGGSDDRTHGGHPDVIALQEVFGGSYSAWCEGLMEAEYSVISPLDLAALDYPKHPYPFFDTTTDIRRDNFNLLAVRHPVAVLPGLSFPDAEEARYAFPEKQIAQVESWQSEFWRWHARRAAARGVRHRIADAVVRRTTDRRPQAPPRARLPDEIPDPVALIVRRGHGDPCGGEIVSVLRLEST